jgi:hypothetical protein
MEQQQQQQSGWAIGWTYFAAFIMMMIGVWHAIAGLASIVNDDFMVITQEYVFKFNSATWGWIHLILGILVVLAGFGLFSGAVWARTVGVILAVVSGIAAFAWLPYQPFWAILIGFAAISVIWALTVHGRDVIE